MKILLVEDDQKVASFINRGLSEQLFHIDIARDGLEGDLMARQGDYDLIILDILLPKQSGIELCKIIRSRDYKVPILMLTALGSTDDKVTGLTAGADDYLVKPFEFKELLARVKALLRRRNETTQATLLKFEGIEMDTQAKTVSRDGIKISLTAREFKLMEYLLRNRGRVVSRLDIEEKVWDFSFDHGTNVVDVYMNFLRKKIDKNFNRKLIHTVVGMGFILKTPD
ncbi:MAG: DNA-binding response regulator [Bacteroidetes bacterium]|nr:MAG: DNA-binding response regulator [Bacteroidota bacterium]